MDEKRIAELRKFIATITDPQIGSFIDLKKLWQSGTYNLAVQMAVSHAIKHGDYGYVNNLFALLEGTVYERDFICSLRPKLNFVITNAKPRKLKKATLEQIVNAEKQAPTKPIALKIVLSKPPKKRPTFPKSKRDLMDSWLMLQGSYGSGKRSR